MTPRKKTLEDLIGDFRQAVIREYGIPEGIFRITLSPELFNQHIVELTQKSYLSPSCISMYSVYGVDVRAGSKEEV